MRPAQRGPQPWNEYAVTVPRSATAAMLPTEARYGINTGNHNHSLHGVPVHIDDTLPPNTMYGVNAGNHSRLISYGNFSTLLDKKVDEATKELQAKVERELIYGYGKKITEQIFEPSPLMEYINRKTTKKENIVQEAIREVRLEREKVRVAERLDALESGWLADPQRGDIIIVTLDRGKETHNEIIGALGRQDRWKMTQGASVTTPELIDWLIEEKVSDDDIEFLRRNPQ